MAKTSDFAHITGKTLLPAAINGWEMFMADQGRSPNTVKAFLSDIRLLTRYLAPDKSIGDITTVLDLVSRNAQDDFFFPLDTQNSWFHREGMTIYPSTMTSQEFTHKGTAAWEIGRAHV